MRRNFFFYKKGRNVAVSEQPGGGDGSPSLSVIHFRGAKQPSQHGAGGKALLAAVSNPVAEKSTIKNLQPPKYYKEKK